MGCVDLAEGRLQWQALLNIKMNLWVSRRTGNFYLIKALLAPQGQLLFMELISRQHIEKDILSPCGYLSL